MASNKWSVQFKRRNRISSRYVLGQLVRVAQMNIDDRLSLLLSIIVGYDLQSVFKADKAGLFLRDQPSKLLSFKGKYATVERGVGSVVLLQCRWFRDARVMSQWEVRSLCCLKKELSVLL